MTDNCKWQGCPYDVEKHEEELRKIELGEVPDPFGSGEKYHRSRIELGYEWLNERTKLYLSGEFYGNKRG